jgi:Family of unknown function (DUF5995)
MPLPAFATLDDVVAGLSGLEQSALARHDRRAVFLTVYGQMSRAMKRMIEAGAFRDNDWVAGYTVRFANIWWKMASSAATARA